MSSSKHGKFLTKQLCYQFTTHWYYHILVTVYIFGEMHIRPISKNCTFYRIRLWLAVTPPARAAAGVGPALACHRCCCPDVGPALDWPTSLPGRWRVAGRGLYVNCSLHSNMRNISISVKTIIIIIITRDSPMSKHWLICFKLSPALSALWTQHCSGVKKEQPYNVCHSSRISYTRISQRDW